MTNENSTQATALIDDVVGGALKYWREMRSKTQEELSGLMSARGFDFHQSTLYKIENGKRRVLLSEAVALAEILDIPLNQLTSPQLASDTALLASLRYGARLELDALERALNALTDSRMASVGLKLNLENLDEPRTVYDFAGVQATAEAFYKPLAEADVKPAIALLEEITTKAKALAAYLEA